MDIRDYLPPSLKHVLRYTSEAEREKRKQASRDAFGRPTPVPRVSQPGATHGAPRVSDAGSTTARASGPSPWAEAGAPEVDRGALPSALLPPVVRDDDELEALPVRRVTLRHVVLGTTAGLLVALVAIAMPRLTARAPAQRSPAAAAPAHAPLPPPETARAASSASALPQHARAIDAGPTNEPVEPHAPSPRAEPAPSATARPRAPGRRPRAHGDAGAPSTDEPVITE